MSGASPPLSVLANRSENVDGGWLGTNTNRTGAVRRVIPLRAHSYTELLVPQQSVCAFGRALAVYVGIKIHQHCSQPSITCLAVTQRRSPRISQVTSSISQVVFSEPKMLWSAQWVVGLFYQLDITLLVRRNVTTEGLVVIGKGRGVCGLGVRKSSQDRPLMCPGKMVIITSDGVRGGSGSVVEESAFLRMRVETETVLVVK